MKSTWYALDPQTNSHLSTTHWTAGIQLSYSQSVTFTDTSVPTRHQREPLAWCHLAEVLLGGWIFGQQYSVLRCSNSEHGASPLPRCPIPRCPPVYFRAALSTPAMSTLASSFRHVHSRVFHCRVFSAPVQRSVGSKYRMVETKRRRDGRTDGR